MVGSSLTMRGDARALMATITAFFVGQNLFLFVFEKLDSFHVAILTTKSRSDYQLLLVQ